MVSEQNKGFKMKNTIKKCQEDIKQLKVKIEQEKNEETKKELKAELKELNILLSMML